jgi:hypothetical protein
MIDLGLTGPQMTAYIAALTGSHKSRTTVKILATDHSVIQDLSTSTSLYFLDGEVNIDAREHVSRSLTMTLLDPGKLAAVGPDLPTDDTLWVSRMMYVSIDTYVPSMAAWVECPVFTGPITKVTPQGYTVDIEAQGKEAMLLAPTRFWRTHSYPRHERIGTIMRELLHHSGEDAAFIDFPTFDNRTHHAFNILGIWPVWPVLNELADELNQQLFYDGSGTVRMRDFPTAAAYTFQYGVDLLTVPQQPIDYLYVRNAEQVRGKIPNSGRQPIATKFIGATSSISPSNLARNGENRYIVGIHQQDHVHRKADAQDHAQKILDRHQSEVSDLEFESFVMPFFDEWDHVQVTTDIQTFALKMMKWTIPLGDGTMSVGFHHRTRITPKKRHKNRRHHHVHKGLPNHRPHRGSQLPSPQLPIHKAGRR